MGEKLRIVHYINQFFGQIGGEDKADAACQVRPGPVGPGNLIRQLFGDRGEIVATVICGDNFMAEDLEKVAAGVAETVSGYRPDLLLAGPAFSSGRYGMACGAVCRAASAQLGIPVVAGMSEDNPALSIYRSDAYVAPAGKSAAKMADAVRSMVDLALCLAEGRTPARGAYFSRGIRETVALERRGAARAVDMLAAILRDQPVETELPLPTFEKVRPAPPLEDPSTATIVLATEGGLTPAGNPDRIEAAMATRFGRYPLSGMASMTPELFTVGHGGYDNAHAKADPNRLVPLDALRALAAEGRVGEVGEWFYTTAGNATSVENAARFGREIAEDIRRTFRGKAGVILTST